MERRSLYCPDCDRKRRQFTAENPNRRCSACRARLPVGRTHRYCGTCAQEMWRVRTQQAHRLCSGRCGAFLPPGKRYNYCSACSRQKRQAQKRTVRLCTWCRDLVPPSSSGYLCRDCTSMRGVEYRTEKRLQRVP